MKHAFFLLATLAFGGLVAAPDVVLENLQMRLVLSGDGYAKSLQLKPSGVECLMTDVRVPFATLTQYRPYDNEYKLMLPAKPWTHAANRIVREGNSLKIEFEDEFNILEVAIDERRDCIALKPVKIGYRFEDFGDKRATEVDEIAFARLPVPSRAHFGQLLNAVWDDKVAVAMLATSPETRTDAIALPNGGRTLVAGTAEKVRLLGTGAAIVAAPGGVELLGRIDAVEREFRLPRGVASRRHPLYAASYLFCGRISPDTAEAYIDVARQAGMKMMVISYTAFAKSCGHYIWRESYPNGLADLKKVTDRIRNAGIVPGLHIHYNKVSTNDPYIAQMADPRMATVANIVLARDISPTEREIEVQGDPASLRMENGRRLIWIGNEIVSYEGVATTRPYRLTGCRRGVHGSQAVAHCRGTYGRLVDVDDWPYFIRVDPETGISDEIAARLAELVDAAGFRFVYYDGAEDVPPPFWYQVPRAQVRVDSRFARRPFANEGAEKSHFGWHLLSRGNAFDTFLPERTREAVKKYILRTARQDADDFSAVNFGWLGFYQPDANVRRKAGFLKDNAAVTITVGTQPDMYEYVAAKAAAWNSPVSVQTTPQAVAAHPRGRDILAALQRWEAVKLGGHLTPEQREELKEPDRECFIWPFGFDASAPELVAWRKLTDDAERPIRAFSYEREGRAGVVYWAVNAKETPEVTVKVPEAVSRQFGGLRFVEAAMPVRKLEDAFRMALGRPDALLRPGSRKVCPGSERWVFLFRNLQTQADFDVTTNLVVKAKGLGYNAVAFLCGRDYCGEWLELISPRKDADFIARTAGPDRPHLMSDERRARYEAVKHLCDGLGMKFAPLLWSTGYCSMQAFDPEMAAALPVRSIPYVARNGKAVYAGGETLNLGVGETVLRPTDTSKSSAAAIGEPFKVKPFRRYRFSLKMKTEGLPAQFKELQGVGISFSSTGLGARTLCQRPLPAKSTQDWTEVTGAFNSEDAQEVRAVVSTGKNSAGELRVKDLRVEEAGLLFPLTREGAEIVVCDAVSKRVYSGGYDYSNPPRLKELSFNGPAKPLELKLPRGSKIANGTALLVDAYEPEPAFGIQFSACLSHPGLKRYFEESAVEIERWISPAAWFLSADEFRVECRCRLCERRGSDMAHKFADAMRLQRDAVRRVHPDAEILFWSDMADENHNARDGRYFKCVTPFKGAADLMPKDLVAVPWWGKKAAISCRFFADRGFELMPGAYYDTRTPQTTETNARTWMEALDGLPGVRGIMYTSWFDCYDMLGTFAEIVGKDMGD